MDRSPHASRRSRVEGTAPDLIQVRPGPAHRPVTPPGRFEQLRCSAHAGYRPAALGSLVVSCIDVGQGDGVLVQSGGESYLLDAGKAQAGPKVVDFLRSRGVESLDGIVVSNPDAEHIGGFEDVLDAFEVANVYLSGDPKGHSSYNSFLRAVRDEGSEVVESRAGVDWGSTTTDAIAPPSRQTLLEDERQLRGHSSDPRLRPRPPRRWRREEVRGVHEQWFLYRPIDRHQGSKIQNGLSCDSTALNLRSPFGQHGVATLTPDRMGVW